MKVPPARFFIVDDDQSFCRSLKRLLNALGAFADCFYSAQSFLDSIHPGQNGYALVDIHMPDCDGFELMKRMQNLHYDMPVIMITGQPRAESRDRAMENGALGFLQKPFSEESLMDLIAKYEKSNGG
jgi:two-component system response regulator FixJ